MQDQNTTKTLKTCLRCLEVKATEDFKVDPRNSMPVSICRLCVATKLRKTLNPDVADDSKRCRLCGITKPCSEFWAAPGVVKCLSSKCKQCATAGHNFYVKKLKDGPISFPSHKTCLACKQTKEIGHFYVNKTRTDWREPVCIPCVRAHMRAPTRKERQRSRYFLKTYGLTLEQVSKLLELQDGKCGVCETPIDLNFGRYGLQRACVDHNHATGKVRGMLCKTCNMHVFVVERPGFVEQARRYLEKHRG